MPLGEATLVSLHLRVKFKTFFEVDENELYPEL